MKSLYRLYLLHLIVLDLTLKKNVHFRVPLVREESKDSLVPQVSRWVLRFCLVLDMKATMNYCTLL